MFEIFLWQVWLYSHDCRQMTDIHPTSIVHPDAEIGENVFIGPFCNIGKYARLADGVQLYSHVVVEGRTTIGSNSRIFSFRIRRT